MHSCISEESGEPRPVLGKAGIMRVLCRTQVGDVNTDHAAWGRAEDMGNMYRPSYSVDPHKPGAQTPSMRMPHGPGARRIRRCPACKGS